MWWAAIRQSHSRGPKRKRLVDDVDLILWVGSCERVPNKRRATRSRRAAIHPIPSDLDLSLVVGEFTTQLRVGQFDLQLSFGPVHFMVQSSISLYRGDELVTSWVEGQWPGAEFFNVMNTPVRSYDIVEDRRIVLEFENGVQMQLDADSERYECMHITVNEQTWVI